MLGWRRGSVGATNDEARRQGLALVKTNRAWLERWAAIKPQIAEAKMEATTAMHDADSIRAVRVRRPKPGPTATASDSSAYWQSRALDAEAEVGRVRVAYEAEKRATALLTRAVDTATTKLAGTTTTYRDILEKDRNRGRIDLGLFSIPKPPKIVAAAIGCTAGALLDKHDALRGCGLGGMTAAIVAPTR